MWSIAYVAEWQCLLVTKVSNYEDHEFGIWPGWTHKKYTDRRTQNVRQRSEQYDNTVRQLSDNCRKTVPKLSQTISKHCTNAVPNMFRLSEGKYSTSRQANICACMCLFIQFWSGTKMKRMNHPGNPVLSWCRIKPWWLRCLWCALRFCYSLLYFIMFSNVCYILVTRSPPIYIYIYIYIHMMCACLIFPHGWRIWSIWISQVFESEWRSSENKLCI